MQQTKLITAVIFGIGIVFQSSGSFAGKVDWNKLKVDGTEETQEQSVPTPAPECKEGEPCPDFQPCPAGEVCPAPADPVVIVKEIGWGEWAQEHKVAIGVAGTIVIGGIVFLATGDTAAIRDAATSAAGYKRYVQLGVDNKAIVDAAANAILLKQKALATTGAIVAWLGSFSGLQYFLPNSDVKQIPSPAANEKDSSESK